MAINAVRFSSIVHIIFGRLRQHVIDWRGHWIILQLFKLNQMLQSERIELIMYWGIWLSEIKCISFGDNEICVNVKDLNKIWKNNRRTNVKCGLNVHHFRDYAVKTNKHIPQRNFHWFHRRQSPSLFIQITLDFE